MAFVEEEACCKDRDNHPYESNSLWDVRINSHLRHGRTRKRRCSGDGEKSTWKRLREALLQKDLAKKNKVMLLTHAEV